METSLLESYRELGRLCSQLCFMSNSPDEYETFKRVITSQLNRINELEDARRRSSEGRRSRRWYR